MKRVNKKLSGAVSPLSAKTSQNSNEAFSGTGEESNRPLYAKGRQPLLPPEVREIMHRAIAEEYPRSLRPTKASIYRHIVFHIVRKNELRDSGHQLPVPHISTFYREFNKAANLFLIMRGKRFRRPYQLKNIKDKNGASKEQDML